MIKLFKQVRQKFIQEKKVSSYLLYAIGEIALVVIGILIALYINNWNQNRLKQNEFKSILNTLQTDLVRDTLTAGMIVKFYKANEENSLKIINQEITVDNFSECEGCRSLITIYQPFTPQTKGHDLFKKYTNQNSIKNDSLEIAIDQFYGALLKVIGDSNEFIKDEVLNNINYYKEKSWFVDWTQGKFTEKMKLYFLSEDYRKRVASHHILAGKNHLLFVDLYKKNAEKILKLIDKRLKGGN